MGGNFQVFFPTLCSFFRSFLCPDLEQGILPANSQLAENINIFFNCSSQKERKNKVTGAFRYLFDYNQFLDYWSIKKMRSYSLHDNKSIKLNIYVFGIVADKKSME